MRFVARQTRPLLNGWIAPTRKPTLVSCSWKIRPSINSRADPRFKAFLKKMNLPE